jgi:hypothetical protein
MIATNAEFVSPDNCGFCTRNRKTQVLVSPSRGGSQADAPSLENALHRDLHKQRLNKVNFRKEFFRVDFDSIRRIVESQKGEVEYHAEPEALQYRESVRMPDEDFDFIEHTMETVAGDADASFGDEE